MRILIVDDSKTMRTIVLRTLRQAGYGSHETLEAGSGVDALRVIKESPPDLIISDWNMPEMSGIDLLRQLQAMPSRPTFGFVTSEGTPDMRKQAKDLGAAFFITKPFTAEGFSSALGAALR